MPRNNGDGQSALIRLMEWAADQIEAGQPPGAVQGRLRNAGIKAADALYIVEHAQGLAGDTA